MSNSSSESLLSVLESRRDCCRELLQLSQSQAGIIETEDYTELMRVLNRKQRLLGRLDQFNRTGMGLREEWHQQRDSLPSTTRTACEEILSESEELLAQILAEEKVGTDALTQRRNHTQQQLQQVSQGVHVGEAYRQSEEPLSHSRLDIGH